MNDILEYFHIPKSGKTKQRISIKEIIDQLNPTAQDKKNLNLEVNSIYLEGVLDAQTLRIPSYVSDEHLYEAIYVLQVSLKTDQHFSQINEKLHAAFPNPLIIVYFIADILRVSLAPKRINKLTKDKTVIEANYSTSAFTIDEKHGKFMKLINLGEVKAINLKEFYEKLTDITYSERLIELIGSYPNQIPKTIDLKHNIKKIEDEKVSLNELKDKYKQASMMSEKMDYHMKIVSKEQEIERIISEFKEELINE
ncbi:MAG: hypothetical protein CVV57_06730 [Tenericutes bacterium HGW-Tenericutes-2]|jgi:hypothetical protein|nr:MAG: hypothetical protein CVV57_06730 [Tenericutes bacterium HGW-Tenericutes-2]PKM70594.1 MAG: hypothetical protein CVU93_01290 [Firmicutes bacterium HGW-Firmicutes-18]